MAIISLNTILSWFENKDKPTQDQFWQTWLSFWHKSEQIPTASIGGLQELLDAKVDKKDIIQNKGVFDPAKSYVFNAALSEYVSFVNEASADEFFRVERWFRLLADTVAGESPETAPAKWKHIGTVLGEIAIEDVVGLREELDALIADDHFRGYYTTFANLAATVPIANPGDYAIVDAGTGTDAVKYIWDVNDAQWVLSSGGAGLTPEQEQTLANADAHMNGAANQKHATNQLYNLGALVKLALAANTDQAAINAAIDAFLAGTINTSAINDPAWVVSESRLAMLQKAADGTINMQGSALLVNIFAPPGVDTYLTDRSGWTGEQKTITAANYNGELGGPGRIRMLADGTICICVNSSKGTSGQANGTATYYRNRAHDMLDPANSQDAAVIAALLLEAGWDSVTNVKVLTIPARKGTFYKDPAGYWYVGYDINGSNSYWWRTGTPVATSLMFNAASHPTLTSRLLAYDFTSTAYTVQAGDETTKQGQRYYDATSRKLFEKVTTTQFERIR